MTDNRDYFSLSHGEVTMWLEPETTIHLKAISGNTDPVELNAAEARELANEILRLAAILDEQGG